MTLHPDEPTHPGPPPGPKGRFFFGNLQDFKRDPIRLLMGSFKTYGDMVALRLGPVQAYLLFHPDHVRHVLQDHYQNYNKQTHGFKRMRETLGNGLLTSEGDFWRRQRRIVQPAFHRGRIAEYALTMTAATEAMLEGWEARAARGETANIAMEMMGLTQRIVGETLLGSDVSEAAESVGAAVALLLKHARERIFRLFDLPGRTLTPTYRRLRAAHSTLDDVVYGMIARRRQEGADGADLLSMLIQARDEETGEGMTDLQIRDEVMTIYLAGHETTANALAWTWYLLAKYPEAGRRLRAELAEVLGGRTPTMEDLPHLTYTTMVIREAMRLYPPAWIISRRTVAADTIGGYAVPAGTLILVSPYVTHRHPQFWENPEGFDPERFAPERFALDKFQDGPKFAYFPFGGGPRQCIGNGFALMEAQLIVATVAQRFEMALEPGLEIHLHPTITLRPLEPITMALTRR